MMTTWMIWDFRVALGETETYVNDSEALSTSKAKSSCGVRNHRLCSCRPFPKYLFENPLQVLRFSLDQAPQTPLRILFGSSIESLFALSRYASVSTLSGTNSVARIISLKSKCLLRGTFCNDLLTNPAWAEFYKFSCNFSAIKLYKCYQSNCFLG